MSTVRSQGQFSLELDNFTYSEVTSPAVALPPTSATTVGFDLWIPAPPANVNWFGGAEIFLTCSSQNVNHAYVGYVNLLPFPLEAFATVSMTLSPGLQTLFQAGCPSLQVGVALSVAGGSPFRLDNFRTNPVVAPPTANILGMERTLDWTSTSGSLAGSAVRTQGQQSIAASGFAYTQIRGAPVAIPGAVSNQIGFDLMVSPQPPGAWLGQTQLFLSAPTENINNALVGQLALDPFVPGQFQTAAFTIPSAVMQVIQAPVTDLSVTIVLNVPSTPSPYLLDNVRFNPSSAACAVADSFTPPMSGANWMVYDTGLPAGSVSSGAGTQTLVTQGPGFSAGGDGILFFYQATSGDFDIATNINVLTATGALSGLTVRLGLSPIAPFAFMGAQSSKLTFAARVAGTQVTSSAGASVSGATWVRLAKFGLTVTGYSSADGVTWQALGAATLPYGGTLDIGLVAASGTAHITASAVFTGFDLFFASGCGRCGNGG